MASKRLLFISLSCVGDAVMTTVVLEALHLLYPDAVIDIVSDNRSSILFSKCPYAGDIIHKEKKKLLRGTFDLLKKLKGRSYQAIIDLRTDGLAYLIRAKKRFTKWQAQEYGPHAVEQFMGVVRRIYGDRPLPATKIWLDQTHENFADHQLSALPEGRWLALGPACGGTEKQKNWPAANYTTLANSLTDLFAGVILLGSTTDTSLTGEISSCLGLPFIDTAGKTDLLQVAALLKRSALFVGSDSGLGHLAAAMTIPTLSFFSVDRPERCLPWGNRAEWLMGPDRDARRILVEDAEKKIRALLG